MSSEIHQLLKALDIHIQAMQQQTIAIEKQAKAINNLVSSNQQIMALLSEVVAILAGDDEPGGDQYLDDPIQSGLTGALDDD